MKLHYLAIIAVTSIAANIGTVSAASIRGIATSDSESTNSVLAKVELGESDLRKVESDEDEDIISHRKLEKIIDEDEDSWDEEDEDSWDYPDDVVDIDEDEEDPDNAELALFGNEFMSEGRGGRRVGNNRRRRNFRRGRNFRRNDFRRGRDFRRNDFRRGRGFSRNSNRLCRELYGRNFRYSSSLGDCIRR
jgi:hypothetical protein